LKFTYLLINFLTVLFPLLLSFDKRVRFYKSWKFIFSAIGITGILFLFWDALFTIKGVWSFNTRYITGITFFHLPVEEILFFVTVPFACVFIYACLNYYIGWNINKRISNIISGLICLSSVIVLVLNLSKLYTQVTFSLVLILVILFQYIFKADWLGRFYRAFLVALIPFYIINGLLTSIPVVLYNNQQNMGIRLGTVPVEDHFYLMGLLLMNIGLFEYFRSRFESAR
jgi:lycopene cyclase domain-containing protein